MIAFYVFCGFILIGLGFVFLLIYKDKKEIGNKPLGIDQDKMTVKEFSLLNEPAKSSITQENKDKKSLFSFLKNKSEPQRHLNVEKIDGIDDFNSSEDSISDTPPAKTQINIPTAKEGTVSLQTTKTDSKINLHEDKPQNLTPLNETRETSHIEKTAENQLELEKLQQKYQRLDELFNEKSNALDKLEKDFQSNKQNITDFNKVKDVLEKEIRDQKEVVKQLKINLNESKEENTKLHKEIEILKNQVSELSSQSIEIESPDVNVSKSEEKTHSELTIIPKHTEIDTSVEYEPEDPDTLGKPSLHDEKPSKDDDESSNKDQEDEPLHLPPDPTAESKDPANE